MKKKNNDFGKPKKPKKPPTPVQQEVIDTIRSLGGTSYKYELAEKLNLPWTTIVGRIERMVKNGILEEVEEDFNGGDYLGGYGTSGGYPRIYYRIVEVDDED